jgi:glucose/mannose-6-phosphate isomerase
VFTVTYKAQPCAALPFSFLPIIAFLQCLGLVRDMSADVAETAQVLRALSAKIEENIPMSRNPAKKLAERLRGYLPVIYGSGILDGVARRWKTQINENAKAWAFHEVFPELNHNAVVGYQFPLEMAGRILVVMLRAPSLHQRVKLRYDITSRLLERAGVAHENVDAEGTSPLSQMMSLVLFGDYVSTYLAVLYGVDPTPVEAISFLKGELGRK